MVGLLLQVKDLSKSFPGVQALKKVNLTFSEGEIVGIAGENGAGKSTILKVLCGIYRPDGGEIFLKGKLYNPSNYYEAVTRGVSMVFQEQSLIPNLRVYENLFLSHEDRFMSRFKKIDRKKMINEAEKNLKFLKLDYIDPTKFITDYTFRERQMIEIARAFTFSSLFNIEMPLILLDEPTSGISDADRDILFNHIRELKNRASFIFISHRLYEYLALCDRVYIFKDGSNVGEVRPQQSTEKELHAMMVGRDRDLKYYKENLQKEDYDREDKVLEVVGLSGNGFRNITFSLAKHEILGIGGVLGCGKEELGRAVMGIDQYYSGKIIVKGKNITSNSLNKMINLGVGYVPKDRKIEGIIPFLSVRWNITLASLAKFCWGRFPILNIGKEKAAAEEYVKRLRIATPRLTTLCNYLSGGNQQKVVLAKWLSNEPDILVLDNLTRGIDVGVKEEIYFLVRQLVNEGHSMILITDDLLELIGLSNRIIIMKEGAITRERFAPPDQKPSEHELVSYMV